MYFYCIPDAFTHQVSTLMTFHICLDTIPTPKTKHNLVLSVVGEHVSLLGKTAAAIKSLLLLYVKVFLQNKYSVE